MPKSTTNEQIDFHADKYQRKFGNHLEAQGYNVLAMGMPEENPKAFPSLPEDRRGFIIWARVSRRPQEIHIDIPDNAVEEVEKLGLKLNE
ncbi:MAG: hypothetical protein GWN86_06905 [Desulfobacterales bacterium]|nr:hypothetical protein [Desulfobacterales bacterium]